MLYVQLLRFLTVTWQLSQTFKSTTLALIGLCLSFSKRTLPKSGICSLSNTKSCAQIQHFFAVLDFFTPPSVFLKNITLLKKSASLPCKINTQFTSYIRQSSSKDRWQLVFKTSSNSETNHKHKLTAFVDKYLFFLSVSVKRGVFSFFIVQSLQQLKSKMKFFYKSPFVWKTYQ